MRINWDKVTIVIKQFGYDSASIRKILPVRYICVELVDNGEIPGRSINLRHSANNIIRESLSNPKEIRGAIKRRAFKDTDIRAKSRTDLWNAAIGSTLKYGIAAINTSIANDKLLQKSPTRRIKEITRNESNDNANANGTTQRARNAERRRCTEAPPLIPVYKKETGRYLPMRNNPDAILPEQHS